VTERLIRNMQEIACSRCGEPAVYLSRASGEHLCAGHFSGEFEAAVTQTIRTYRMIEEGDRIAVALSGGKDSSVLLALLHRMTETSPDISLIALTIDEGIEGYREETMVAAGHLTRELGIPHRVRSFREIFGNDLDTLVRGREETACSICGTLRRRALNTLAREEGATKLATGHCMDDEAQSILMNFLRGDLERVAGCFPHEAGASFVSRIKPLRSVSEREVVVYALLNRLFRPLPECPYTRYALRADARRMLATMECRHPGTLRRIIDGQEELKRYPGGRIPGGSLSFCHECGEPARGFLCATCTLLQSRSPSPPQGKRE
jgi:uncharacterized protein (TIGR00269 family)